MGYIRILAMFITLMTVLFSLFNPVAALNSKVKELQDLQSSSNLIELTGKEFEKYVLEEPRPYDLVIYYTLSHKCDHWVNIESELAQVSYSYSQSGMTSPSEDDRRPIFFVKLEYSQETEKFFLLSQFTSVPVLAYSKPSFAKSYAETKLALYPSGLEWKISSQDFTDAGKLIEHVNKLSGIDIELKYTLFRIMMGNIVILGALAVLFFAKDYFAILLRNKIIWMIGTTLIFILCIGGTAFNMIHGVPTFRYNYDEYGGLIVEEYFQKSQRSQYAGEGYLASMLMFTIGALLVGFSHFDKLKQPIMKEILCMLVILLVYVLVLLLNTVFGMKAQHYNPTFFPPDHYMRGPFSNDQGTNI